jgi:hypothetical protein
MEGLQTRKDSVWSRSIGATGAGMEDWHAYGLQREARRVVTWGVARESARSVHGLGKIELGAIMVRVSSL